MALGPVVSECFREHIWLIVEGNVLDIRQGSSHYYVIRYGPLFGMERRHIFRHKRLYSQLISVSSVVFKADIFSLRPYGAGVVLWYGSREA